MYKAILLRFVITYLDRSVQICGPDALGQRDVLYEVGYTLSPRWDSLRGLEACQSRRCLMIRNIHTGMASVLGRSGSWTDGSMGEARDRSWSIADLDKYVAYQGDAITHRNGRPGRWRLWRCRRWHHRRWHLCHEVKWAARFARPLTRLRATWWGRTGARSGIRCHCTCIGTCLPGGLGHSEI